MLIKPEYLMALPIRIIENFPVEKILDEIEEHNLETFTLSQFHNLLAQFIPNLN